MFPGGPMRERLILLTNDDGLWAPGLDLLAGVASRFGRVVAVAPDRNRSGISSAMSLHGVLRLHELGGDRYACDGTPVDCVLLGIRGVLEGRVPDWVLSGVNRGLNLGEDVFYSGTVAAAFEGSIQGARAAAISLAEDGELAQAEAWIARFLEHFDSLDLAPRRVWNLNLPAGEPKGFRLGAQDSRSYHDQVERRLDPRGTPYFWIGGAGRPTFTHAPGSDAELVRAGWAAVTPLRLDLTDPDAMGRARASEVLLNG